MKLKQAVNKWTWAKKLLVFFMLSACIEPINFNAPPAQFQMVVEGMISDDAGPYTVKLSTAISLNSDTLIRNPIEKAKITLFDDEGNSESLTESGPGIYTTTGIIQGVVGHSYYIHIETLDGKIYESVPDKLNPGGEVSEIRFEYEPRVIERNYGTQDANIFNIFIDANEVSTDIESYVRWRYTGTYKVETHPELHQTLLSGFYYRTPVPCSGYIIEPALGGGKLTKIAECTCCTCWVNDYESIPHLSDKQFISNSQYRNVKVAEVPVNSSTFTDKFMIEVEQMSLSKQSFDFFNLIRTQKNGATSLFQPPYGEIKGNIKALNSSEPVIGLFWATSIKSKYIFIQRSDVPYKLTPPDFVLDACTIYPNSSTTKPPFW